MTYQELRKKIRKFKHCGHLQVKMLDNTTDLMAARCVDDVFIVTGSSGESNGIYILVDNLKS